MGGGGGETLARAVKIFLDQKVFFLRILKFAFVRGILGLFILGGKKNFFLGVTKNWKITVFLKELNFLLSVFVKGKKKKTPFFLASGGKKKTPDVFNGPNP